MNVTSTSPWNLAQIPSITPEPGVSPLTQFASTKIPKIDSPASITSVSALKNALQTATDTVRRLDLCPQIGDGQPAQLEIIPFKEIPNYVRAGDIVSFVTTDDAASWRNPNDDENLATMIKQRGWHAEIIAPSQGNLVVHGQWGGSDVVTPVEDVRKHPHYNQWPGIWNLHFFRFSPPNPGDQARFASFMQGLEAWSTIVPKSTWPSNKNFNPILFSDVDSLRKLGDTLIQKHAPPEMVCIQWVHAVFSLACCYPLGQKFLSDRGVLSNFTSNFPSVHLLDDSLKPFDALPWAPYHPSYIIRSFLDTYFEEDLSEDIIQSLPEVAQIPSPVIMPIVPLLEMRRKSSPSNFNVAYVCTAVADEYCIAK
jgi:hypothetical protein